jgi:sugar phosphate isomerase/epimerase
LYSLGVNLGFAVNRFPEPEDWIPLVSEQIGVRRVQFVADLLNPSLPGKIRSQKVRKINSLCEKHGVAIESAFTGAFTRVNHFGSADPEIRSYWKRWFFDYLEQSVDMGVTNIGGHPGILSQINNDDPVMRTKMLNQIAACWQEVFEFGAKIGLDFIGWEPMSIEREIGHTIIDAQNFQDLLNANGNNFRVCLDLDHGDLTSPNSEDRDPVAWIRHFSTDIGLLHLKQTTPDRRRNMPFTKENNQAGTVNAELIISELARAQVPSCSMFLELGFRERNPDDKSVVSATKESVAYWIDSGANL